MASLHLSEQEQEQEQNQTNIETVEESKLNINDVLCGRGGWVNSFSGNRQFRELLKQNKNAYSRAKKKEKMNIIINIIKTIRSMDPPGRFLIEDKSTKGYWVDIGDTKALKKCSQAMRETKRGETIAKNTFEQKVKKSNVRETQGVKTFSQATRELKVEESQQEVLEKRYQSVRPRTQSENNSPFNASKIRKQFHRLHREPSYLPPPPPPPRPKVSEVGNAINLSEELMKESLSPSPKVARNQSPETGSQLSNMLPFPYES